ARDPRRLTSAWRGAATASGPEPVSGGRRSRARRHAAGRVLVVAPAVRRAVVDHVGRAAVDHVPDEDVAARPGVDLNARGRVVVEVVVVDDGPTRALDQ